jgi:hypothetical protein
MGYGEFGGGGSVDWEVNQENAGHPAPASTPGRANSRDPIAVAAMGLAKGAPGGHFRVDVMYDSPADAAAALSSIAVQGATLVLFVRSNTAVAVGPARNPPQVRVSW